MDSSIYARCDGKLILQSNCDVYRGVLCFTRSSCFIIAEESIHVYCLKVETMHYNLVMYLPGCEINLKGIIGPVKYEL
jgi:hypothetical protein